LGWNGLAFPLKNTGTNGGDFHENPFGAEQIKKAVV
jgi:hypothetical protein